MQNEWKQTGLVPWLGMKLGGEQAFAREEKGRSFIPVGSNYGPVPNGLDYIQRRVKELLGATKYWTAGLAKRVETWIVIDAPDVVDERLTFQRRRVTRKAALVYGQSGWKVVVLHNLDNNLECSCGDSACDDPGKHPRVPLDAATSDRDTITGWFHAFPDGNIGIRLDGLSVLAVTPSRGTPAPLAALELEHGALRAFARQETTQEVSGQKEYETGWHYVFQAVPGVKTALDFKPGLSFLTGPDSYIVASPWDIGGEYKWTHPWPEIQERTAPPQWLLDVIAGGK